MNVVTNGYVNITISVQSVTWKFPIEIRVPLTDKGCEACHCLLSDLFIMDWDTAVVDSKLMLHDQIRFRILRYVLTIN